MKAEEQIKWLTEELEQAKLIRDMAVHEVRRLKRTLPKHRIVETTNAPFSSMMGQSGYVTFSHGRLLFQTESNVFSYASGKIKCFVPDENGTSFTVYTKNGMIRFEQE
jgi:hypothetical protein